MSLIRRSRGSGLDATNGDVIWEYKRTYKTNVGQPGADQGSGDLRRHRFYDAPGRLVVGWTRAHGELRWEADNARPGKHFRRAGCRRQRPSREVLWRQPSNIVASSMANDAKTGKNL